MKMNVFQYAACEEKMFENYFAEMSGYKRKTTFFADLSIAEFLNEKNAIEKTVNESLKAYKTDKVYITELALATNLKSWEWASRAQANNDDPKMWDLEERYKALFYKVRDFAYKNLDDEGKQYFFRNTD